MSSKTTTLDERIRDFFSHPVAEYTIPELAEIIGVSVTVLEEEVDREDLAGHGEVSRTNAEFAAVTFWPAATIEAALAAEERDYNVPAMTRARTVHVTLPEWILRVLETEAARLNKLPTYAGGPVPRTIADVIHGLALDSLAGSVDEIRALDVLHPGLGDAALYPSTLEQSRRA